MFQIKNVLPGRLEMCFKGEFEFEFEKFSLYLETSVIDEQWKLLNRYKKNWFKWETSGIDMNRVLECLELEVERVADHKDSKLWAVIAKKV